MKMSTKLFDRVVAISGLVIVPWSIWVTVAIFANEAEIKLAKAFTELKIKDEAQIIKKETSGIVKELRTQQYKTNITLAEILKEIKYLKEK